VTPSAAALGTADGGTSTRPTFFGCRANRILPGKNQMMMKNTRLDNYRSMTYCGAQARGIQFCTRAVKALPAVIAYVTNGIRSSVACPVHTNQEQ
jgi:hypothetical protein